MIDQFNLPGAAVNADHIVYSSYFNDHYIIQQTAIVHPKCILIDSLRNIFRKDSIYTYRDDQYGYPLTPDLTGKEIDSPDTTKILISDSYRYETKFYPAMIIKSNGGSYKPNSFNQDMTLKYRSDVIQNEFGGRRVISTPTHRVYTGKWDFEIGIYSESLSELNELVDITSLALQFSLWHPLRSAGLFVKSLNIGSENAEPYANDYVYSTSITLNTQSEWRAEIPIDNLVEKIVLRIEPTFHQVSGDVKPSEELTSKYESILEITQIT
jgi:hypothetical protein